MRKGTYKHSPETRAKIAESLRGRKHTPERCRNISEAKKGKKASPETRARQSAARRGKKHSPETRAKIAAANTKRNKTQEMRDNSRKHACAMLADPNNAFGNTVRAQISYDGAVFDSKTELAHYLEISRDPRVVSVEKVRTGDPRHAHPLPNGYNFYPDFYVVYDDGHDEYIESKPFSTLDEVEAYELKRFNESDIRIKLETYPGVRLA